MPNELIANARMYAIAPTAAAAWRELFGWLARASGIALSVIDHAFPAPLGDLWARSDLACTFMCGWPWWRQGRTHRLVAAPVPSAPWSGGRAVYCSHFIVRADSPFTSLESTFGHRFAFTIADSHSGYNAPRHHLMAHRMAAGRPLFSEVLGPLTTPRRVLEAIIENRADVGPQDSFAFSLMCRHLPELTRQVRVVASTPVVPIPALMASRGMTDGVVEQLAAALLRVGDTGELQALRADLCITGFARLDPATYGIAERWAEEAEANGLAVIA